MTRGPDCLPRRAWTAADNEQLRALMAEGLSRRAVAAGLKRTENAVRMQCRKLGLQFCEATARARASAAVALMWQSSSYRAKVSAGISAAWTADRRARQADAARGRRLWEFGQAELAAGSEARRRQQQAAAKAMRALRKDALAWCPLEYRQDYRMLQRVGGYRAAEARALIEQQIASDLERYAATGQLPQAERQQSAGHHGARCLPVARRTSWKGPRS